MLIIGAILTFASIVGLTVMVLTAQRSAAKWKASAQEWRRAATGLQETVHRLLQVVDDHGIVLGRVGAEEETP